MDPIIQNLESTTFSGRRFTRKQLEQIQDTVKTFSNLSLRELGHTICEHLNWQTPKGKYKIQSCLKALEQMEKAGLLSLPQKRPRKKTKQKAIEWTQKTQAQPPICCELDALHPIKIKRVVQPEDIQLWNEYIDRYHYLRYRRPVGSYIKYFITGTDQDPRILGCLLFSISGIWALTKRDRWIGWTEKHKRKNLNLILNNSRFLIFPWVNVRNLASKVLSTISKQIGDDWSEYHGYRPVLLETFVDSEKYVGTSYKAANWQCLGKTSGRDWKETPATAEKRSPKDIYVYSLDHQFKEILKNEKPANRPKPAKQAQPTASDDPFIQLWQKIMDLVSQVAQQFDEKWQQRRRLIDTMLIILFIFRLVFSKNQQGYQITIIELWDQCKKMNYPLPQAKPPAASALYQARMKLDECIFKDLNTRIIQTYEEHIKSQQYKWKHHRTFAVDGSKINLPLKLESEGYDRPVKNAHYPQGLVSNLYQLKSKIPFDFALVKHNNERKIALDHLKVLMPDDVVVYDRGYFSYEMLYRHLQQGLQVVFRIKSKATKIIDEFIASDQTDKIVTLELSKQRRSEVLSKNPDMEAVPLPLRLIKYVHSQTTYILGTTLLDQDIYKVKDLSDLYHARWGIEESYKISKVLIDVEDFHSKSDRGVKQELYAHFVLITLNRLFANQMEEDINHDHGSAPDTTNDQPIKNERYQVNFKNVLITIARQFEGLFARQAKLAHEAIQTIFASISACRQKIRPGRKYERVSKKPVNKWRLAKEKRARA
jgi:hypothetical protein